MLCFDFKKKEFKSCEQNQEEKLKRICDELDEKSFREIFSKPNLVSFSSLETESCNKLFWKVAENGLLSEEVIEAFKNSNLDTVSLQSLIQWNSIVPSIKDFSHFSKPTQRDEIQRRATIPFYTKEIIKKIFQIKNLKNITIVRTFPLFLFSFYQKKKRDCVDLDWSCIDWKKGLPSKLERLDVSFCANVDDFFLFELSECKVCSQIKTLKLKHTGIRGFRKYLSKFSELESLDLLGIDCGNANSSFFTQFKNLRKLKLSHYERRGALNDILTRLDSLTLQTKTVGQMNTKHKNLFRQNIKSLKTDEYIFSKKEREIGEFPSLEKLDTNFPFDISQDVLFHSIFF